MTAPVQSATQAPSAVGRKATIASRVSAELRQAILRCELAPGAKVNLDRLRERYQVSLSPLREAVSRLVADGLVEFEDQCGYRITGVSLQNLHQVTRLRADLESLALGHAIDRHSLPWESAVVAAAHRLARTARDPAVPESIEQWEAAHTDFHLALVRGCDMPLLISYCTQLHNLNDRYRRLFITRHRGDSHAHQEHLAIAQAVGERQRDQACSLLRAHIERTGSNLASRIGDQLPSV